MKRFAGYRAAVPGALVLAVLALAALPAREARAAVSAVPSAIPVTGDRAVAVTITYRFSGVLGADATPFAGPIESLSGDFVSPLGVIGTVPTFLIANIAGGAGQVTETITIPLSVLQTLRGQGFAQMRYQRAFAGAVAPESIVIPVNVTGEAAAAFAVKRIELYFENRRGEITVRRNQRGLKAFADIRFTGSGVLSGFWEVDGRRILDVNRQLNFGTNVTLATPDIPDLPTFDTGTHIVRFVITNPAPSGTLPQLLYFVAAAKELQPLRISAQVEEGKGGAPSKHVFAWEKPAGIDLFLLEFREEAGAKPVFSAFTREGNYMLPGKIADGIFARGKTYYWRVKGYDANEDPVAESPPGSFVY